MLTKCSKHNPESCFLPKGTPGLSNVFLILSLLSLLCFVSTGDAAAVQRLNYGVLFEPTHQLYLGQEYWAHTFQIPLPKPVYLNRELYCNNAPQCKYSKYIIKTLNTLRTQTMASVNSTVQETHALIPQSPIKINSSALPDLSVQYLTLLAKSQNLFLALLPLTILILYSVICNSLIVTMLKLLKLWLFKKNICLLSSC